MISKLLFFFHKKKLLLLGWLFLILSVFKIEIDLPKPSDSFLFVIDTTMSMNANDMQKDSENISRIDYVRSVLTSAIKDFSCGTEVGLGIFAGYQTTILYEPVEVCNNYSEIIKSINYVNTKMIWAGDSEVSKGIYNSLKLVKKINPNIRLIFLTDGHEAPPISPLYRPQYNGKKGEVSGILFGVGGSKLVSIPKMNAEGDFSGQWQQSDVLQIDPFSLGRKGSDDSEKLVNESNVKVDPKTILALQATPGKEHLTQQKKLYLKLLSNELKLDFSELKTTESFVNTLEEMPFTEWRYTKTNLSPFFAFLSLLFLVFSFWPYNFMGTIKLREYS